jgi:hypothetical protein
MAAKQRLAFVDAGDLALAAALIKSEVGEPESPHARLLAAPVERRRDVPTIAQARGEAPT